METSSYFIPNKALFGSMPDQNRAEILENLGVVYFIDLTSPKDVRISHYITKYTKIKFPIQDRKIPRDLVSFSKFIYMVYQLIKSLKDKEKIYIHCKGGHGRSGVAVACLLCLYLKIPPEYALDLTRYYHQQRKEMREKWRKIGSPQTFLQKDVVLKLFHPVYFNSKINTYLSNSFKCEIHLENVGVFPNVEAAYQAMKNPKNTEYIEQLKSAKTIKQIKTLGKSVKLRHDWSNVKEETMHKLVKQKFEKNEELRSKLLNTYLGPIIYLSVLKTFWKDKEHNRMGKLLQRIRKELV
jgi:predicted NAD-dependent protein-ADP-ribosyltransferase YbiA (DUF1768 family)